VMLLDDKSGQGGDLQLQSLAHGVILLERLAMEYGAERRRLQIMKLRGVPFRGGYHDFRILTGQTCVYPRILRHGTDKKKPERIFESGSAGLDTLLGGGLLAGTSTLVMGSAGTGKSVLSMQYATTAALSGIRTRVYLFDERLQTALIRADALAPQVASAIKDGSLQLKQIEPTEMSPGEFAQDIVKGVEHDGVGFIVIDSINGYMQAMPAERLLLVQVHELLSYLSDRGVPMVMTLVQHGVFGGEIQDAAQISYLADTVVLLRYFEHEGAVRRAISVVKKRVGSHETTIREAAIGAGGIRVGAPLQEFRGVLTGVPEFLGKIAPIDGVYPETGVTPRG
jgi:circadian clock protein KaiC